MWSISLLTQTRVKGHDEETGGGGRNEEEDWGELHMPRTSFHYVASLGLISSGSPELWGRISPPLHSHIIQLRVDIEEMELLVESKVKPAATFHYTENQLGET